MLSTVIAVLLGVPLGVVAARRPGLGRVILAGAGVLQVIPSLALFGLLLPVPLIGGIGARSAIVALVVYALLPIVRSTLTVSYAVEITAPCFTYGPATSATLRCAST